jgi:hypothetical protein
LICCFCSEIITQTNSDRFCDCPVLSQTVDSGEALRYRLLVQRQS